jgi:hypothetical protein
MSGSGQPSASPGWALAALLSLALHILGALVIWCFSLTVPVEARRAPGTSDAGAPVSATEVSVVDVEVSSPAPSPPPAMAARSDRNEAPQRSPLPGRPSILPVSARGPRSETVESAGPNATGSEPHGDGGGSQGIVTAFFNVPARGRTIVYVIDRSQSMGANGDLTIAKRELEASLERLPVGTRFQVIAYNRSAEPLHLSGQPELLIASPDSVRQAIARIGRLDAEGGTDHLAALKRALALHPDAIYFLTDADDLLPEQVWAVTVRNQGRTVIHAIDLNPLRGAASPLDLLARQNGGQYRAVACER